MRDRFGFDAIDCPDLCYPPQAASLPNTSEAAWRKARLRATNKISDIPVPPTFPCYGCYLTRSTSDRAARPSTRGFAETRSVCG